MKSLIKSARLAIEIYFPALLIAELLSASYVAKLQGAESNYGPSSSPKTYSYYSLSKPEMAY